MVFPVAEPMGKTMSILCLQLLCTGVIPEFDAMSQVAECHLRASTPLTGMLSRLDQQGKGDRMCPHAGFEVGHVLGEYGRRGHEEIGSNAYPSSTQG
jgi:hypothetical protein